MTNYELVIDVESALLVGGYATPSGFLDATTAVDAQGLPILPSSTIKGALREALTRMARGEDGGGACDNQNVGCGKCIVCELFGAPGSDIEDVLADNKVRSGASGKIFIDDAHTADLDKTNHRRALRTRHGVGIDRHLRAATHEVLFEREVLDAPGTRFIAPLRVDTIDEDRWALFRYSLDLVTGIGNSRSRGLGRVRMALREATNSHAAQRLHEFPKDVPEGNAALVVIEVLEPTVLGGFTPTSNFLETLEFVPGSAIRGAIANAAVAIMGDIPAFQEIFVNPDTCLLFSDAHATPAETAQTANVLPVPVPSSSLACKHEGRADGQHRTLRPPRDGLLSVALATWLIHRHGGSLGGHRCPDCKKPLGRAHGTWPRSSLTRRVVTRLARDIHVGSAMPGMLYSLTQIEPPAVFVGTVARLSTKALEALSPIANVPLRIGRGRSRGQGAIRIRILPSASAIGRHAIERRGLAYHQSMAEALGVLQKEFAFLPAGAIAVLARTDLAISPTNGPAELLRAIYGDQVALAGCAAVVQMPGTRSGWNEGKNNEKAGPRSLEPVVRAGSAWLFVHADGVKLDSEKLARLEVEGVGRLRELGLGRLVFNHELFSMRPTIGE